MQAARCLSTANTDLKATFAALIPGEQARINLAVVLANKIFLRNIHLCFPISRLSTATSTYCEQEKLKAIKKTHGAKVIDEVKVEQVRLTLSRVPVPALCEQMMLRIYATRLLHRPPYSQRPLGVSSNCALATFCSQLQPP